MKTLASIVFGLLLGAALNEWSSQLRFEGYREAFTIVGNRMVEEQEAGVRRMVEFERLQASICSDHWASQQIRRVQKESGINGVCR